MRNRMLSNKSSSRLSYTIKGDLLPAYSSTVSPTFTSKRLFSSAAFVNSTSKIRNLFLNYTWPIPIMAGVTLAASIEGVRSVIGNINVSQLDNYPEHKHTTAIMRQAFADLGFKGFVYVEYKDGEGFNAAAQPFYTWRNGSFEKAARVLVHCPRNIRRLKSMDQEIYAAGGHEAIHILHSHHLIQSVTIGLSAALMLRFAVMQLNFLPVGLIIANAIINKFISHLEEIDADCSSAIQLKTAEILSAMFKGTEITIVSLFTSTHPPDSLRRFYLSYLKTSEQPLFFQTKEFKHIQDERKREECEIQKMLRMSHDD